MWPQVDTHFFLCLDYEMTLMNILMQYNKPSFIWETSRNVEIHLEYKTSQRTFSWTSLPGKVRQARPQTQLCESGFAALTYHFNIETERTSGLIQLSVWFQAEIIHLTVKLPFERNYVCANGPEGAERGCRTRVRWRKTERQRERELHLASFPQDRRHWFKTARAEGETKRRPFLKLAKVWHD